MPRQQTANYSYRTSPEVIKGSRRLFALLACCAVNQVHAAKILDDPHQAFDFTAVHASNIEVKVITAKNVQKKCDEESNKRGYGGFKLNVQACSFWDFSRFNNKCTIVLPEKTNLHTIGHEVRHCFQGNWHD